jgi:LysR family transcriptional regulator, transcriptional activator of nhaA
VGFNPLVLLMLNGANGQVDFQFLEDLLDFGQLNVVLPQRGGVRTFSHPRGSFGVSFFDTLSLVPRYRKRFPASLDGAFFLMPLENATLRRSLEQLFETQRLFPRVVGEFQDSALLEAFRQAGVGVSAAPTAVEDDIRQHRVSLYWAGPNP